MRLLWHNKWNIIAVAVLLISGCNTSPNKSGFQGGAPLVHENNSVYVPETSALRKSLQIATVEERLLERPIRVPGEVEADPSKMIKVTSPVTGRIVKLFKKLGDKVNKGEALFTLDSSDLAQSFNDAAKSQEALNLAKRNLDRQRELNAAGISPRKELDSAENEYNQAVGEAERAKARLSLLGISLNQGNNRLYTFTSPIDGLVIELTGTLGAFWNDLNAPILTIANLSSVWVAASIQEKEISSVFRGQTAQITFSAYEGESFNGKVQYVGETFDPDTHTVKVRIALDNRSRRFRPGMFCSVVLKYLAQKTILVPEKAIIQRGFNSIIFVETSPWRFEPRLCKLGVQLENQIEIKSGLKDGDRIVIKEGVLLND